MRDSGSNTENSPEEIPAELLQTTVERPTTIGEMLEGIIGKIPGITLVEIFGGIPRKALGLSL